MAIPGVLSGLNHSSEIQACGLMRTPLFRNSRYRACRQSSSQVPLMSTPRSLRRSSRSCGSAKEAQANLRGMALQDPRTSAKRSGILHRRAKPVDDLCNPDKARAPTPSRARITRVGKEQLLSVDFTVCDGFLPLG